MEKIKDFFFRTKIKYTGIVYFLYILYRWFGCPTFQYLCGQSLEAFQPVFFVVIYYVLILLLKFALSFFNFFDDPKVKVILIDFFAEVTFYITTAMMVYDEQWGPYFHIITPIVIFVDIVFAFFIFRRGFTYKYNLVENEDRPYINILLWFIVMLVAIIAYYALTYFLIFLWRTLIADY